MAFAKDTEPKRKLKRSLQGNESSASAREIEILSAAKFRCPKDFVVTFGLSPSGMPGLDNIVTFEMRVVVAPAYLKTGKP